MGKNIHPREDKKELYDELARIAYGCSFEELTDEQKAYIRNFDLSADRGANEAIEEFRKKYGIP